MRGYVPSPPGEYLNPRVLSPFFERSHGRLVYPDCSEGPNMAKCSVGVKCHGSLNTLAARVNTPHSQLTYSPRAGF